MTTLFRDLRLGWRTLARSPGVSLTIVFSLGLGIGAVTTAVAWYDGWVRRPIPLAEGQDRLVWLQTRAPGGGTWAVSYPTARDWAEGSRTLEAVSVFNMVRLGLREEAGGLEHLTGMLASANYFDVLKVRPHLGRFFHAEEETAAAPVVVLGHSYWERRFRADPGIIGRRLNLSGHDFTVIGVAPRRFGGSYTGLILDAYLPVTTVAQLTDRSATRLQDRGSQWLDGVARLAPDATLEAARAEATAIGDRLAAAHPGQAGTPVLTPLQGVGASQALRPVLVAMIGVTALVLLIACFNVANLMLARAAAREREFAVRVAVGAGRGRIVRQQLAEALLLALAGGALGVLVAGWSVNLLLAMIPPAPFPIGMTLELSPGVLALTAGVTIATLLVFGLLPAARAARPDLVPALKEGALDGRRGSRLRGGLVAAQVALSMVALVCAGLFVRGLQRAATLDHGYGDPERLLLVTTNLRLAGRVDAVASRAGLEALLERLQELPGVSGVAAADFVPLGFGGNSSSTIEVEGYTAAADEDMSIQYAVVTDGYFATIGMPVTRGRTLAPGDGEDAPAVAVVNEAFVRRFLAGREAVGQRFRQSGQQVEIVGVVRDARYARLDEIPVPMIYRPFSQRYRSDLHLHLRTTVPPAVLVETVRRVMVATAPDLPFLDPRTLTQQMVPATLVQRIGAQVLGAFGLVALVLAAIGLYGVVSYAVARRTRELGVRMALGAGRRAVMRLVMGDGLRVTVIGIAVGALLSLLAGRALASQLFGLNPADPATYLSLALLLLGVAAGASLLPARRASRVDPIQALRHD